jgi:hypothetical protein
MNFRKTGCGYARRVLALASAILISFIALAFTDASSRP